MRAGLLAAVALGAGPALGWPAELFSRGGPVPIGGRADVVLLREGPQLTFTVALVTRGPSEETLALLASPPGATRPAVSAAPRASLDWLDGCTAPQVVEVVSLDPCAPEPPPRAAADAGAEGDAPALDLVPPANLARLHAALQRLGWKASGAIDAAYLRVSGGGPVVVLRGTPRLREGELQLPPVQWRFRGEGLVVPLDARDGGVAETQLWVLELGLAVESSGRNAALGLPQPDGGDFAAAVADAERALLRTGATVLEGVTPLTACRFDELAVVPLGFDAAAVEPPAQPKVAPGNRGLAEQRAWSDLIMPRQEVMQIGWHLRRLAGPRWDPDEVDRRSIEQTLVATRLRLLHGGRARLELWPAAPRADGTSAVFTAAPSAWHYSSSGAFPRLPLAEVPHPWAGPVKCELPRPLAERRVLHTRTRGWTAGVRVDAAPPASPPAKPLPALGAVFDAAAPMPAWERRFLEQQVQLTRLNSTLPKPPLHDAP